MNMASHPVNGESEVENFMRFSFAIDNSNLGGEAFVIPMHNPGLKLSRF